MAAKERHALFSLRARKSPGAEVLRVLRRPAYAPLHSLRRGE
jgi:hypothetical protein